MIGRSGQSDPGQVNLTCRRGVWLIINGTHTHPSWLNCFTRSATATSSPNGAHCKHKIEPVGSPTVESLPELCKQEPEPPPSRQPPPGPAPHRSSHAPVHCHPPPLFLTSDPFFVLVLVLHICAVTVSSTGAENQFQVDDNGHVGRPSSVKNM